MTECELHFGNKDTALALVADMDHFREPPRPDDRKEFGWGLVVSFVLHALAAVFLTGIITGHVTQPLQDTVEVELVPPPVEAVPEAEEEAPEAIVPEEEPEAEETPPPPPPPPPEAPEAVEPPTETPVVEAVEEFGEEDTGPSETAEEPPAEEELPPDETAEEEPAQEEPAQEELPEEELLEEEVTDADPEETPSPEEPLTQETAESDTDEADTAETEEAAAEQPEPQTEEDLQDTDVAEPDTLAAEEEAGPESGTDALADVGVAEEPTRDDFGVIGPIATDATPKRKPPAPVRTARRQDPAETSGQSNTVPAGMLPARELFSRVILDDPRARSAMREMSEGQRLNLLCMTELRAQISAVSALPPELLPRFRPPPGNVLQPRSAAFRSLGRWFDVSFRCETDRGVTRVENFAFKIGNEIPQSQWLERGLTGF